MVELHLSHNKLKHLKSSQFKDLNYLKNLWLDSCRIESIEDACFSRLIRLEKLDLHNNNIPIIKANLFFDLKALKTLWISRNQVVSYYGKQLNHDDFQSLLMKLNARYIQLVIC